jgi:hypothetical protein
MDIIEKETVKEVPVSYWEKHYGCDAPCGYGYNYSNSWGSRPFIPASRGVAGAALGIGIGGLALGLWNAAKNGTGFNLFGGSGVSTPENVNINTLGTSGASWGYVPSVFDVLAKENSDIFNAQKALYDYALLDQNQRFMDRQTLNSELFGVYKSQIDADFGLYKSQRDATDLTNNRITNEIFSLYKETRDKDDEIKKELCDLKAMVAINSAVRPYQDKLIQCEIDKAFTAGINYTDKKTCNVLYGQVVLPNAPTVTGFVGANQCGCPRIVTAAAAGA